MSLIDRRLALVLLFALSACGGAGSVGPPSPSVAPNQPGVQSQSRQTQSDHETAKPRRYAGTITDLLPPCGQPSFSCTGKFAVALTSGSGVISGTWTEDFTNPTLHDQGTFTGVMTGPTTFTATFVSPADAPCTLAVSGTLTPERFDAAYQFNTNRGCPVVDNGTINLRHADGDDGDRDRDRDRGEGHHGDG
jgi:predicted small lipoprotein YifL